MLQRQALSDLLELFSSKECETLDDLPCEEICNDYGEWPLSFDDSSTYQGVGAEIIL